MSSVEYQSYKGIPFPLFSHSVETLDQTENEFQLLDDDVINVAYPKSGTNWIAEILALISHKGDPTWVRNVTVWDRSPWIESDGGLKVALQNPPPRLLCSHLAFQIFPKSFLQSKAKVIYTLRHPKDVLVSYYHFVKMIKIYKTPGSLQEFMEDFLSGNELVLSPSAFLSLFGSWFDHVKGWTELKGRPNIFYITYEELQQDLRGCAERICRFLGKELNSQQIDSVVEYASFRKMKENKMSNYSLAPDTVVDHEKGEFMRKGISGDWKNHLTVAQNQHFDRVYRENMQGWSTTFPWD